MENFEGLKLGLERFVEGLNPPAWQAALTGSWAYGLAGPGSDIDLRGVFLAPLEDFLGLGEAAETSQQHASLGARKIDFVAFELRQLCRLMLKRDGGVLEALFSPLTIVESPEILELRELSAGCLTRHHGHHYRGLARTQEKAFEKGGAEVGLKPLTQALRALWTGRWLVERGELELDWGRLAEAYSGRNSLAVNLAHARRGGERALPLSLEEGRSILTRAFAELDDAMTKSPLPETPYRANALGKWLVDLRIRKARASWIES